MGNFLRHQACDKCGSSDGKAIYSDGSFFCWVCNDVKPSEEYLRDNSKGKPKVKIKEKEVNAMDEFEEVKKPQKAAITDAQREEIKQESTTKCKGFRGLRDETCAAFGVRTSFDEETGEPVARYYPVTQEGLLTGYKVRELPKTFRSVGRTGADCELFGQFKFNRGGKYVLLVEGEEDQNAAYQMLLDYNKSKGSDFETAVVSPTTGAQSKKQIASQYKFFDQFSIIVVCLDSDDAGKKATEEIIKYLPKGKVRLMQMRYKDPSDYLQKSKQKEFISDFYNAKAYVPAGVVGSSTLYEKLIESTNVKKIPLPPFMKKLDEMLGAVELGTIGFLSAGSGSSKTTFANEMIYFWLFNSPYKVGVVSLELTCGQYAQAMLSRHIEQKISNIREPEDKLKFLQTDRVKEKAEGLFKTEDGSDRWMLIDERDGSIEVLQDKIEEMIISCDCKVIILDPISDLFDGLSNEEQSLFMKWQKSMVKNYNVTFINIAHIRKSGDNRTAASTGAFVPEEAISGASQQFKSASWIVMMSRDKYADNDVTRNTTHLVLSKNRSNGVTGRAGSVYYCNQTHRLYDFDDWSAENGIDSF